MINYGFTFIGKASHAGNTPMKRRYAVILFVPGVGG
jgi:hypothetical protein